MPDVRGMVNDPRFQQLDQDKQRETLVKLDPRFGQLTPEQFTETLTQLRSPTPQLSTAPAPPAAPPPSMRDPYSGQAALRGVTLAGQAITEGLVTSLGLPSDLIELAVNGLASYARYRANDQEAQPTPSDQITGKPKEKEKKGPGSVDLPLGSQELLAYVPEEFQLPADLSRAERILTTTLKFEAGALLPIAAATKLLTYADPQKILQTETALAATGGLTAGILEDIWGKSPMLEFLGGLMGSIGPQAVMAILRKAKQFITAKTGTMTEEELKGAVGEQLHQLTTEEAVTKGVEQKKELQKDLGPEFKPSTGQAVGSPALVQSERGFERGQGGMGAGKPAQTLAENQAVVRSYLEKGAPEGQLADTVTALEATRNRETALYDAALLREQARIDTARHKVSLTNERILQQADERAAAAEARVQARVNALTKPDGTTRIHPAEVGRIIRREYQAERDAFMAEAQAKYEGLPDFQVDPTTLDVRLKQLSDDLGVTLQGPAATGLAKVRAVIPDATQVKQQAGFLAETPSAPPRRTTFHELHQALTEVRRLKRMAGSSKDFLSSWQLGQIEDEIVATFDAVKQSPPPGAEGAVEALARVDDWYRGMSNRLHAGEAGALRYKDKAGRFETYDEDVAGSFLRGDTPMDDFVQAIGSRPAARDALRNYARLDFFKKAVSPHADEVNVTVAQRWLNDHEAVLRQFPELKDEFGNLQALQRTATALRKEADLIARNPDAVARLKNPSVFGDLDEAERQHASLLDLKTRTLAEWQKGIVSDLLGYDADRAARAIVGSAKPKTLIAEVNRKLGSDPEGQAGFTRALWDAALDKFSSKMLDSAKQPVMKYRKMADFLRDNEEWMTQRFGAERIQRMRTSLTALEMLERTGKPVLPGGSDTAANVSAVLTDWGPFLSRLYAERSGRASMKWVMSERVARVLAQTMKARTEEVAINLVGEAFYDPESALQFMKLARQRASAKADQDIRHFFAKKAYLLESREAIDE